MHWLIYELKLPKIIIDTSILLNILNKSENATPELFAIFIQNYASQECNGKCFLMFKYWVMHNSKSFTDVVTRKHVKAIYMWQGSIFLGCQFERKSNTI